MAGSRIARRAFLVLLAPAVLLAADAPPKGNKIKSELAGEPVAKTLLLMRGINAPNMDGLASMLRRKPQTPEAWNLIGAQALLIAENGNLLLLRPPRKKGHDNWLELAVRLRTKGKELAEDAEGQDYASCRTDLKELANTCNRCHRAFNVSLRVNPFTPRPLQNANKTSATTPTVPSEPRVTPPPRPPDPPEPPAVPPPS